MNAMTNTSALAAAAIDLVKTQANFFEAAAKREAAEKALFGAKETRRAVSNKCVEMSSSLLLDENSPDIMSGANAAFDALKAFVETMQASRNAAFDDQEEAFHALKDTEIALRAVAAR